MNGLRPPSGENIWLMWFCICTHTARMLFTCLHVSCQPVACGNGGQMINAMPYSVPLQVALYGICSARSLISRWSMYQFITSYLENILDEERTWQNHLKMI